MLTHFVVGNGLAKNKSRKKFVEELKIFVLKKFSHNSKLKPFCVNMCVKFALFALKRLHN